MRYVAVSDIHAERDKLTQLMTNLKKETDFRRDTFVFLGDYVDGGPDARNVIADLMSYERQYPHWIFLKGNHEDMLLDAVLRDSIRYGTPMQWYTQGGYETVRSYTNSPMFTRWDYANPTGYIPLEHLEWLAGLPSEYVTKKFIFVHAGLKPGETVATTPYDDKLWIRSEFFSSKHDWGKRVIFGHTVFENPLDKPNMLGLDTMHHGHGHITAAILDEDYPETQTFVTSEPYE